MILLTILFNLLLSLILLPIKLALRGLSLGARLATKTASLAIQDTEAVKSITRNKHYIATKLALKNAIRVIKALLKAVFNMFKILLSFLSAFWLTLGIIVLVIVVLIVSVFDLKNTKISASTIINTQPVVQHDISSWLAIVKDVKSQYASQHPEYNSSTYIDIIRNNKTISSRVDCTGYVTTCLKFFDNSTFTDDCNYSSASFTNPSDGALLQAGFTYNAFTTFDSLLEGDIVFNSGHVEIFSAKRGNTVYVYNTGSTNAITFPGESISDSDYIGYWRPPSRSLGDFIFYLQTDSAYATSYNNGTLKDNGCGATSLAMVLATLTGDRVSYTPNLVAETIENKLGVSGNTVNTWDAFPNTLNIYNIGYKCEVHYISAYNASNEDFTTIKNTLSNGGYVIISTGGTSSGAKRGIFTTQGHYIVIRKFDNNLYYVADPNDANAGVMGFGIDSYRPYNQHGFTQDEIQGEMKGYFTITKN